MNNRLMNCKQSSIIVDFLLSRDENRNFKSEDLLDFDKTKLNFKTSIRVLRDLRYKGFIRYVCKNRSVGIYTLQSSYEELLKSKKRVEKIKNKLYQRDNNLFKNHKN